MAAIGKKNKNEPLKKTLSQKEESDYSLENDPNAVHDIYSDDELDQAYDKTIADDIAFDNED